MGVIIIELTNYIWPSQKTITQTVAYDATRKLDLVVNSCQIIFMHYDVQTPMIQFKLYNDAGQFSREDYPRYDKSNNYLWFSSNSHEKNCLIRFLIPQDDSWLGNLTIHCHSNCVVRSINDKFISMKELRIISQRVQLVMEKVEINLLVIDSHFFSMLIRDFRIKKSFLYAVTGIVDIEIDSADSYSFYSLGNIELENLVNLEKKVGYFSFDNIRSICPNERSQIKLNEYIVQNEEFDPIAKKFPDESKIMVPIVSYNQVGAVVSSNLYFVQHLALSLKVRMDDQSGGSKYFPSQSNKPEYSSINIVPSIEQEIRNVIVKNRGLDWYSSYIFNIRFLNFLTQSSENIIGAYFSHGISSYPIVAFLDAINPLKIRNSKIYFVEVAAFHPYLVQSKEQQALIFSTIRKYICDKITEILASERIIDGPLPDLANSNRFYILNADAA